ncbi:MAG: hypothetical protein WAU45_18885 [Blastocatellia bacterium]
MRARMMMTLLSIALLVTFSSVASARAFSNESNQASPTDNLSGKYEGVAKSDQLGDIPLTVEIKNDNGKLSGKIDTPQGPAAITSGTYADGKVTMKFDAGGNEGTVTATVAGDKITGKWELAGQGGPLELKRASMVAASPSASAASGGSAAVPAAGDVVSGDWDASADAQGTAIPFTLKLKLDGDKVTGTSDSAQGSAPLSKGTYAAGKLSFTLDTPNGAIGMTGMIKDGKIVGEFDFAGQMTGKWEATKKK